MSDTNVYPIPAVVAAKPMLRHTFSINSPSLHSPSAEAYTPTPEEIADALWRSKMQSLNEESMFVSRPASEWVDEAARLGDPIPLWGDSLWFEHEVACLFADTNVGKSILAVQIADEIASAGHRVVYFDFEMSAKQFQMRYTDAETKEYHQFSPNLMRVEVNPDRGMSYDVVKIANAMRDHVNLHKADVMIIDNISWLCNETENGEAAGQLMQILIGMKREMNISILVLAHTPKRGVATPLTQNSLAGSKKIANFMDSIFAIGRDMTALPHGRYLKQIKVRSAQMVYHDGNVLKMSIEKCDNMLRFTHSDDTALESQLLGEPTGDTTRLHLRAEAHALREEGLSIRKIAQQLGISKSTASRILAPGSDAIVPPSHATGVVTPETLGTPPPPAETSLFA